MGVKKKAARLMGRKGQEIEGKQSAERDVESNNDM